MGTVGDGALTFDRFVAAAGAKDFEVGRSGPDAVHASQTRGAGEFGATLPGSRRSTRPIRPYQPSRSSQDRRLCERRYERVHSILFVRSRDERWAKRMRHEAFGAVPLSHAGARGAHGPVRSQGRDRTCAGPAPWSAHVGTHTGRTLRVRSTGQRSSATKRTRGWSECAGTASGLLNRSCSRSRHLRRRCNVHHKSRGRCRTNDEMG